jgi:hypothetical protein
VGGAERKIAVTMTNKQANELAKKHFERLVGRPHPWEGVQPWVLAAMREAYQRGAQSTPQPADVRADQPLSES